MSGVATNPKTGAPIKIIQLETSIWRNAKTLVWFDATAAAAPNPRFARWEVGAESIAAADALLAAGLPPDVILCLDDPATVEAWLAAGHWSKTRLTVIPKETVTKIGVQNLAKLRVTNMLCLDEIHELYPFVGHAWDGTLEDAKALTAITLRMRFSFPVAAPQPRAAVATSFGVSFEATLREPSPLVLVTQYYSPDKSRRRKELAACLEKNVENPIIDKIVLLNEAPVALPPAAADSPKVEQQIIGHRPTYADVFRWMKTVEPETIVAFANSDIVLDAESWRPLWATNLERQFLALLRYEVTGLTQEEMEKATLFGPRPDSQDTWVVRAGCIQATDFGDYSAVEFPFGQAGCDNAITLEMFKKRFVVSNPALTLRTYHFHTSQVRTYDPANIVDKPAYLYIAPSGMHDLKPQHDLTGIPTQTITSAPISRPIKGPLSAAQARTFCTMVGRATQGAVQLDPEGQNMVQPPAQQLYTFSNVFETREGLIYGYDTLYVGRAKATAEAWGASELSSLSASLPIESAFIAPLPNAVAADPARYVLEYLAKLFLIRDTTKMPMGEFWCAKQPKCIEALKMFHWPAKEVPVLSRDENHQVWCKSAQVLFHQDQPAGYPTREEIAALRKAFGLGGWREEIEEKRLVFLVDEAWLTTEVAEAVEVAAEEMGLTCKFVWPKTTALDTILSSLLGAWGVVVADPAVAGWSWLLPKGATVWEIQSEMEPSAKILSLAGAADLQHRLLIVPKGAPSKVELARVQESLCRDLGVVLGVDAGAPTPTLSPGAPSPLCIIPKRTGYFSHAGDSFREMLRLWEQKGYIRLEESSTACQVWLGGVGDTLLYDRPTLEWLVAAPPAEQTWRKALFGNPIPPKGGAPWTFWPRRPQLVEDAVAAGIGATPYEDRTRCLVFYGKSENAVQRERRTKEDWSGICDEFYHVDSSPQPYAFTQMEYLKRLASARYGLCLAGYGRKCHREIECMAMGCVPIVAPEVDMESYAEPPQVGVHYFRVLNPVEARHVVDDITPERWAKMSAACRDWWARNASAAGSWELTKRLVGC